MEPVMIKLHEEASPNRKSPKEPTSQTVASLEFQSIFATFEVIWFCRESRVVWGSGGLAPQSGHRETSFRYTG